MKFTKILNRYTEESGIVQLMEDLGDAMSGKQEMLMLGGGNPAHIPEVQAFFHDRMQRIIENPAEFLHIIGDYDPPKGDSQFITAVTDLLNAQYDWQLSTDNVVLTAGSQAAFFMLFNMLAGEFEDGSFRKILLPLTPEYIGYTDVGLFDNLFLSKRPTIETFEDNTFKYHIDFDSLEISRDIGAICVSRPTNPTGNVLSDTEMQNLAELAVAGNIPLIVDNAYGMPFPNIIFADANPVRNRQTILCMSLSKLGLPGLRTGIVIAHEEIADAIARINGIINLALGSFGPALAYDLIKSGEVLSLSKNVIQPYYRKKAEHALQQFHEELAGLDYYIHRPEGAIFLWLWFPGLPISSEELYQRLKQRGVLIVPGHHFFPGLDAPWQHKNECIRVSYAMNDNIVSQGINIIADELRKVSG